MAGSVAGISSERQADDTPEAVGASTERQINRLLGERDLGWVARAKFQFVRAIIDGWVKVFGLTGLYWLGGVFAAVEFAINARKRRRYRQELHRIFPEGLSGRRARKLTRRFFRRVRCDKLFYLVYDRLPRHKVLSRIHFKGRDNLDDGLARGGGVYLAMSHNGSHHVLGMLLSLLGYELMGIRDRNEGAMRSYIQQVIGPTVPEFGAVQMIFADDFPREIFRCFRENRLVVSALDVSRARGLKLKTCEVRIFGEQREFLTGTMQIALRCGAVIVPAFVVSRPNFHYRIVVHEPLYIPGEDETPQLDDLMQRYADHIQRHLRSHPDHVSRV